MRETSKNQPIRRQGRKGVFKRHSHAEPVDGESQLATNLQPPAVSSPNQPFQFFMLCQLNS